MSEKSNRLYHLPLFIVVPIAKKIYGNESLRLMFDGHINHSPGEIKKMIEDVVAYGEKHRVRTTSLKRLFG